MPPVAAAGSRRRRSTARSFDRGTTPVVAKERPGRFPGFELAPDYAAAIRKRLDGVRPGLPLEGSPDPTAGGAGTRAKGR